MNNDGSDERHDTERRGGAWPGGAWRGRARQGLARLGVAGLERGVARQGLARLGVAGSERGEVRRGRGESGRGFFHEEEGDMSYLIEVKIEGISPLLQHRFLTAIADQPHTKRTGRPDYKEEAEQALYRTPEGLIYQPAIHLERAIQRAATNFKIAGRRGKSYRDLVASSVFVRPDQIPHLIPEWVIDERPVVIQRNRIIRYRPRFDQWKLAFTIEVLDDQLPKAVLKELLDYAGRSVGIGDFRPRCGRFIVTQFEET